MLVYMAALDAKQRNLHGRKDDWIFTERKPKLRSAEKKKGSSVFPFTETGKKPN